MGTSVGGRSLLSNSIHVSFFIYFNVMTRSCSVTIIKLPSSTLRR